MTNDIQHTQVSESNPIPAIAARLKSAREAMGLERKDAAAQLRLNEKVIAMLESDPFLSDLPPTFVRGYLRAYGKLLHIPEQEIKAALEPLIKPEPAQVTDLPPTSESAFFTHTRHAMPIATSLILLTLFSLVVTWWFTHSSTGTTTTIIETPPPTLAQNNTVETDATTPPSVIPALAAATQPAPASVEPTKTATNKAPTKTEEPKKPSAAQQQNESDDETDTESDTTE